MTETEGRLGPEQAHQQAMLNRDIARLAYTTKDGTPRVVPRGEAALDEVEGIPDEYLQMSGSYTMTPEQRVVWEAEVRSLYASMVRIVVKPTWAKLIDFDETLPSPVEELIRRRDERERVGV